jgi:hypothetical protein
VFSGRIRAAHRGFQGGAQVMLDNNLKEFAAQWTAEDAEGHAVAGQCDEARREANTALQLSRDNFTLERSSRILAYCGAAGEVPPLLEELARRFPEAALTLRVQLPVATAAAALKAGQSARALSLLEPVKPYDNAPAAEFWPSYLRGLAYLQAKDGGAAIPQFQAIIDRRGKNVTSPLFALAHLGLARAAAMSGAVERARHAYETFLALWKDADSDLELIGEARRELTRLQ